MQEVTLMPFIDGHRRHDSHLACQVQCSKAVHIRVGIHCQLQLLGRAVSSAHGDHQRHSLLAAGAVDHQVALLQPLPAHSQSAGQR